MRKWEKGFTNDLKISPFLAEYSPNIPMCTYTCWFCLWWFHSERCWSMPQLSQHDTLHVQSFTWQQAEWRSWDQEGETFQSKESGQSPAYIAVTIPTGFLRFRSVAFHSLPGNLLGGTEAEIRILLSWQQMLSAAGSDSTQQCSASHTDSSSAV